MSIKLSQYFGKDLKTGIEYFTIFAKKYIFLSKTYMKRSHESLIDMK